MKICPTCNQTYTDNNLNFCLNDGGLLKNYNDDTAPPTVMFNQTRTTQENWKNVDTSAPWQNQPLQAAHPGPVQQNQGFSAVQYQAQNQTLPTVSLVLGMFGILFTCCYGGIPLGAAAVVTGYLGLKNYNENPQQFGGRGLAITGIVTGIVGLLISIGIILFAILAQF